MSAHMASIYRKKRSPYWFAAYRDSKGQRKNRSTKLRDRKQAMRIAIKCAVYFSRAERIDASHELNEDAKPFRSAALRYSRAVSLASAMSR